jgi:hypothetical protein
MELGGGGNKRGPGGGLRDTGTGFGEIFTDSFINQ